MDANVSTEKMSNKDGTGAAEQGMSLHALVTRINAEISGAQDSRERRETSSPAARKESLGRHIFVELAGVLLAVPMDLVVEAGELEILQPLPLLAPWLPGVTNVRGNIIPVVDLEKFLGAPETRSRLSQSFLIVDNSEMKVAITVHRIVRTRILYRAEEQSDQSVDTPFAVNKFFSGQAAYEQDGREQRVTVFDLDAFLRSDRLRHPVAG